MVYYGLVFHGVPRFSLLVWCVFVECGLEHEAWFKRCRPEFRTVVYITDCFTVDSLFAENNLFIIIIY